MAKGSVARRPTRRRGRSLVAMALLGFVLVATSVIWRRTFGYSQSRTLIELERRRANLEARRAQLHREVRDAASSARLGPVAEQRLRMRIPPDSQVIVIDRKAIPAPARDDSR